MREKVKVNWRNQRWFGIWFTVRDGYWSTEMSNLRAPNGRLRNSDPLPGDDSNRPWYEHDWELVRDLSSGMDIDAWRLKRNGHHYTIYND